MTVRLGFAVAAFLNPEILVVDEVLAVGDAEFQKKAIGKMKEVSEGSGRTVLFVSHNMASISALCTRAIMMENGTISCHGKVSDVISRYLDINIKQVNNNTLNDDNLRRGNGKARIVEFLINKDGYNDDENIDLIFTIKVNEAVKELYASVVLKNPVNDREIITTVKPQLIGKNCKFGDELRQQLTIQRASLREANYPLYLWLGNINKEIGIVAENEPYDVIDGVYTLKIKTNKNRLELGYDPNSGYSGYFNMDYKLQAIND